MSAGPYTVKIYEPDGRLVYCATVPADQVEWSVGINRPRTVRFKLPLRDPLADLKGAVPAREPELAGATGVVLDDDEIKRRTIAASYGPMTEGYDDPEASDHGLSGNPVRDR